MAVKKKKTLRKWVQLFFFLLLGLIAVNHSLSEQGGGLPLLSDASLHAVCPFGGVVSIYQLMSTGDFVKKIHASSFILMIIVALLAVIAGPLFCGWICPFGTFQEWVGKLGHRIWGKRYNRFVPDKLDSLLRYARYIVVGWVLYVTAKSATLVFAEYDPFYALFNFWTGEVAFTAFLSLAVVTLLSLFIERPFCKYACPYGAVLGLFNLIRVFKLKRNSTSCIHCKGCDKICPMNIKVSEMNTVRHHQCISCFECTEESACPVPNTLEFRTGKYPESVKGAEQ